MTFQQTHFFLRPEAPADVAELEALSLAAFALNPHSRQTEAQVVAQLRAAGDLFLSLVAQSGQPQAPGALVGHAVFTRITIDGGACDWFALGPLCVLPFRQGAGVGTALVQQGLRSLQQQGAAGCVVLGEPAYYGKFGFRSTPALRLPDAAPGCFLARPFARLLPMGTVHLHPAFKLAPAADWTFP
jgi:putative acetyltransferase